MSTHHLNISIRHIIIIVKKNIIIIQRFLEQKQIDLTIYLDKLARQVV